MSDLLCESDHEMLATSTEDASGGYESAPPQRQERRKADRREPHQFKAELRLAAAGFPMTFVNLSSTGLLAETSQRLCPGRTLDVFVRYGGIRKVLRATVVRAWMHALAPQPVFRAALHFENALTFKERSELDVQNSAG